MRNAEGQPLLGPDLRNGRDAPAGLLWIWLTPLTCHWIVRQSRNLGRCRCPASIRTRHGSSRLTHLERNRRQQPGPARIRHHEPDRRPGPGDTRPDHPPPVGRDLRAPSRAGQHTRHRCFDGPHHDPGVARRRPKWAVVWSRRAAKCDLFGPPVGPSGWPADQFGDPASMPQPSEPGLARDDLLAGQGRAKSPAAQAAGPGTFADAGRPNSRRAAGLRSRNGSWRTAHPT